MANSSEISITESQIMSEGDQSTPIVNKRTEENEIVKIMQTLFEIQNYKFDEKFNELKEQNSDLKSDTNEIRKQNCDFDKRINEIHARLDEIELENKRGVDKLDINKDKVSSSENYDKINKNMVIGDNSVDVGSDNEILMRVEFNDEEIVVDESERGGKESLSSVL